MGAVLGPIFSNFSCPIQKKILNDIKKVHIDVCYVDITLILADNI